MLITAHVSRTKRLIEYVNNEKAKIMHCTACKLVYNILLYHVWNSQLYNSLFFGSTVLWTMHWNFWCWEIMVQMCGRTSSEFKWTSLLHHGQSLLSYSYYVIFLVCFYIYGHCIFYLHICVCTCNRCSQI